MSFEQPVRYVWSLEQVAQINAQRDLGLKYTVVIDEPLAAGFHHAAAPPAMGVMPQYAAAAAVAAADETLPWGARALPLPGAVSVVEITRAGSLLGQVTVSERNAQGQLPQGEQDGWLFGVYFKAILRVGSPIHVQVTAHTDDADRNLSLSAKVARTTVLDLVGANLMPMPEAAAVMMGLAGAGAGAGAGAVAGAGPGYY